MKSLISLLQEVLHSKFSKSLNYSNQDILNESLFKVSPTLGLILDITDPDISWSVEDPDFVTVSIKTLKRKNLKKLIPNWNDFIDGLEFDIPVEDISDFFKNTTKTEMYFLIEDVGYLEIDRATAENILNSRF